MTMKAHFASPLTSSNNQKDKTMNVSALKKPLGTLALLAAAGMALTGCSVFGGGEAAEAATVDGVYVMAPQDGGLFTLSIAGKKLDVKHQTCREDDASTGTTSTEYTVTDPRETAFGELSMNTGEETGNNNVTWLEGGVYTQESAEGYEILSEGQIFRIGERNFFNSTADQGKALLEQFTDGCTPEPVVKETPEPSASPTSSPTASPSATVEPWETPEPSGSPSSEPSPTNTVEAP